MSHLPARFAGYACSRSGFLSEAGIFRSPKGLRSEQACGSILPAAKALRRMRPKPQTWRTAAAVALPLIGLVVVLIALLRPRRPPAEPTAVERRGEEIVVAGQLVPTGTPVVLWSDPGGYNAYLETRFFAGDDDGGRRGRRFRRYRRRWPGDGPLRDRVEEEGWTLPNLQEIVRLFVIHYDVCVTSRRCFSVLHDSRGLSVHFMLDLDGTIYQTLDLAERALHAGNANNESVGVEIAHIGAYPDTTIPDRWYQADDSGGLRVVLPENRGDGGVRTPGFVARPARPGLFEGEIHGQPLVQYDFTDAQYEALARLAAALSRVFPQIRLDAPRDAEGGIYPTALTRDELAAFGGLLGHWHLTRSKIDPGPAFDWNRLFRTARSLGVSP